MYHEEIALIWEQNASKAIILQSFILRLIFKTSHILCSDCKHIHAEILREV